MRDMVRSLSVTAALVLALMGCSINDGGKHYDNLESVADKAGCTTYESEDQPMMYASETVTCAIPGEGNVTLNWFNNNKARDKHVEVGIGNGALYVVGDKWSVECRNPDQQHAVTDGTGGEERR